MPGFGYGEAVIGFDFHFLAEVRDKERGILCRIKLAVDGVARCLPPSDSVLYTDENCTAPIAVRPPSSGCGPQVEEDYGVESYPDNGLCRWDGVAAFRLGKVVDPPARLFSRSAFGCVTSGPPNPSAQYRQATPVLPDAWVRFDEEITPVTDRLGVWSWKGSDGSRLVRGLVLLPDKIKCEPVQHGSGPARCIPSDRLPSSSQPYPEMFADSTCEQRLASRCLPSPALIEESESTAPFIDLCASRRYRSVGRLFRVGAEIEHNAIYTNSFGFGTCELGPDTQILGAYHYYPEGAEVAFEDYPIVGEAFSGTGRLQQAYYVAEDSTRLCSVPYTFYDTELKDDCYPQTLLGDGDGRTFCVADRSLAMFPGASYYGDTACTTKLTGALGCPSAVALVMHPSPPDGSCEPPALRRVSLQAAQAFDFVGPSGPGLDAGPSCAPQTSVAGFDVGAVIDPAEIYPLLEPVDF